MEVTLLCKAPVHVCRQPDRYSVQQAPTPSAGAPFNVTLETHFAPFSDKTELVWDLSRLVSGADVITQISDPTVSSQITVSNQLCPIHTHTTNFVSKSSAFMSPPDSSFITTVVLLLCAKSVSFV